eukprot:1972799-Pleurochrysis_carterae.AAC.2
MSLAASKSSVSGTEYLRHAASNLLTVPGLSPSECSAAKQQSSCSCICTVARSTSCLANWGRWSCA